eukprot:TRINITY_DN22717_c0_g1_i1.p1 TRINITY_DN22717_c0_g1~~TRINITY_DN22717_c0_g1_i1.p1  ORF type:complete len:559 (-),score=186.63 TRINITY_DN22717_c0_g1_i1:86-1705(-)
MAGFQHSQSVILLLISLVHCILPIANSEHVFDVYRLFQLEKNGQQLGSQKSGVNLPAVTVSRKGSLSKHIVVVPLRDFKASQMDEILFEREAGGLLVLLPKSDFSGSLIDEWRRYEQQLAQKSVPVSVYFAFEDAELSALVETLDAAEGTPLSLTSENYQLVAPSVSVPTLKGISAVNFQGYLAGAGYADSATPSVAVVAYYDAFSVVPQLAFGADSSASGVVAVLELARIFARLYESQRNRSPYHLVFLLTGAGAFNFEGTKQFIARPSSAQLLESLEFVLCLESIGSGNQLYFHSPKVPRTGELFGKIFESFKQTAQQFEVPLEFVHKKINISNPTFDWQHELFSRKLISAATVTSLPAPPPLFGRSHLFDNRSRIDTAILTRNVRFVAESIAKHIYNLSSTEFAIIDGSHGVDELFVEGWIDAIAGMPRYQPLLTPQSPFIAGLSKTLSQYTTLSNETFVVDEDYVFHAEAARAAMTVFKTRPFTFDLLLSAAVIVYLCAMFVALQGPTEALAQAKKLFTRPAARGSKPLPKKKSN